MPHEVAAVAVAEVHIGDHQVEGFGGGELECGGDAVGGAGGVAGLIEKAAVHAQSVSVIVNQKECRKPIRSIRRKAHGILMARNSKTRRPRYTLGQPQILLGKMLTAS